MSEENAKQLDDLIGKEKVYKGKIVTFKSFKEVGQIITVKTNGRMLTFLPSEINAFIYDLEEAPKNSQSVIKHNELPTKIDEPKDITINGYQPSKENIMLKKSLMDVLKEINDEPTDQKIKKAKSICDVANTMVNIQKAEISLINAVKR